MNQGRIIVITGSPGTGKTTTASIVAKESDMDKSVQIITVFVFSRVRKLSMGLLCDTAGLGLVLGQVIGRWGNFFNREAFGGYTDGLFAMQLPLSTVRSFSSSLSPGKPTMTSVVKTISGINLLIFDNFS